MIQIDSIYKIIDLLEKYKDANEDNELLNDIHIIDNMIRDIYTYNSQVVNDIKNKYSEELNFLCNLEQKLRPLQVNYQTTQNTISQQLSNLRHSLIRIQIKRLLDRKGKKMLEDDLINNNNDNLFSKLVEILND